MLEEILTVSDLSYRILNDDILTNISFTLFKNEFLCFLGNNGVGKSVLAQILYGEREPENGILLYKGEKISAADRKKMIGYIPEECSLFGHLTVAENLFVGSNFRTGIFMNSRKLYGAADEYIRKYGLNISADQYMKELTPAKHKMVMLLRYLINTPPVLVVDSAMDFVSWAEAQQMQRILKDIKKNGASIIYFTFEYDNVSDLSDRVAYLRDGMITYEVEKGEMSKEKIVALLKRDVITEKESVSKANEMYEDKSVVLELKEITASKVPRTSLKIREGEVTGVIGLWNSGVSNFFNCLAGINRVKEGSIYVQGELKKISKPADAVKCGIRFCSDEVDESVWWLDDRIRKFMTMSVMKKVTKFGFINKKYEKIYLEEFCRMLEFPIDIEQFINTLNYSNYAKMMIASSVISRPKVLLLNKITRGLDEQGMKDLYKLLERIKEKCAVVINLSKRESELALCDRIVIWGKNGIEMNIDKKTNENYEELVRKWIKY